jgi:uncharacterized membrane protein YhaH (DUF805 family)
MQEYIAMWKNFANFNDRTTVRGYWMATLINFVVSFGLGLLADVPVLGLLSTIYSIAVIVPGIALCVRRLNDSGRPWYNIFWSFLPIAGLIILIVKFCKPSIEGEIPGKVTV